MTNQNIVLPAIALRGTTILPGMIVHFDVSRERSVKAIEAAMLHDQKIFLVTQIDPEVESPDLAGVYHVGTIAYIKQVVKLPQNLLRVLVEGTGRATLVKFEQEFPFIRSEITPVDEEEMQMPEPVMEAMHRSLKELFHRYCMENGKVSKELVAQILNIDNVEELVEQIAVNIPLSYQNKQKILEALTLEERYEVLGAILGNEIEIMQIGRDLQKKVKARIDKNQREYILREQLKLIREELGEDNTADDAEEFKKKLQELQAGDEVKEKISKEIERFKNTNSNVSENAVLRGYIETMLALPWEKKSTDSDDLKEAWKVLQEGHYGLKAVSYTHLYSDLKYSTDVGDVSWIVPTVHLNIPTFAAGTALHSWQAVAQGKSSIAHKGMLYAAKIMALTALDFLQNPELANQARKELTETLNGETYPDPLPKDLKPEIW